jgi:hypothetical protein
LEQEGRFERERTREAEDAAAAAALASEDVHQVLGVEFRVQGSGFRV